MRKNVVYDDYRSNRLIKDTVLFNYRLKLYFIFAPNFVQFRSGDFAIFGKKDTFFKLLQ